MPALAMKVKGVLFTALLCSDVIIQLCVSLGNCCFTESCLDMLDIAEKKFEEENMFIQVRYFQVPITCIEIILIFVC